ncbi:hypothetical protein CHAB381_0888 [Campylobacter hominis ATCC BAA-381]|uniref:Uncharacterized protein n=1 Tax=Campylobacter hominis (strain ATCC BAA-381 / DSM 21671 / CCUG 45161 / LMG 19568 / NCTC 13146 / CH001A) TaxID=360107 RepID=A7I1Q9_CAMHC|nr:hypothetical protein CHAB381_0888 [Campylobacter hominis ATCC BAA-381]
MQGAIFKALCFFNNRKSVLKNLIFKLKNSFKCSLFDFYDLSTNF